MFKIKDKSKKPEICAICNNTKEMIVMTELIVYFQYVYRLKYKNIKRVSLRRLTECAIKEIEKRGSIYLDFSKKKAQTR